MSDKDIRPADFDFSDAEIEDVDLAETEVIVDGARLTDERADEIAADVLAKARGHAETLVPGGKSLTGDGKHSPIVQTRVPEVTRDKLKVIADRRGVGVSKVLRIAIDELIEREGA
ncbi:DNA-binding protein [Mycolicibacterium fluoranthenivorans]|uniref:Ribbon-helix-helix protein, CopG family n=1 Tax=Mycolicibacterium fluoranthenivorans TaxID=258505 RepID=A0A7X5U449_9MYCO|nr:DNA-binding protein [Mycolicibacterium fluoranthenivorans]MCV7358497.1 DNA-binding protein [Mycolicibacterium fluoranthenivorans]NIH98073.1 hypothetical protein [Mycolicibacterium fluoranthenivorans]